MADNVGGFINISKEIRNTNVGGRAVAMDQVRDPAATGTTSLARAIADETRISAVESSVALNLLEATSPKNSKFMIGSNGHNFQSSGSADERHFDDVFALVLSATRSATTLRGSMRIDKHINNVNWPAQYYFFIDNNELEPTINGTDVATSDMRDFMGSARRMFESSTSFHEQVSDTDKTHTITIPNENFGHQITHINQNNALQVIFNFADFDVDVASFIGRLFIEENTGDGDTLWTGKTRVRFDRVSPGSGRYTMTLGTNSAFDAQAVKVSDIFNRELQHFNFNTGSHPNQVQVNGQVGVNLPYIPDSELLAEILFNVEITES